MPSPPTTNPLEGLREDLPETLRALWGASFEAPQTARPQSVVEYDRLRKSVERRMKALDRLDLPAVEQLQADSVALYDHDNRVLAFLASAREAIEVAAAAFGLRRRLHLRLEVKRGKVRCLVYGRDPILLQREDFPEEPAQ